MAGWGDFFGAIGKLIPGRRESKQNEIDRLLRENAELQKHDPFTSIDTARYVLNADRIKRLRSEVKNIT